CRSFLRMRPIFEPHPEEAARAAVSKDGSRATAALAYRPFTNNRLLSARFAGRPIRGRIPVLSEAGIQLFYSPTSPYARKCRVVARERGLMADLAEVDCNPTEDPAELHASNPLGKVPCLVLDDGMAIFDSPVIAEYLDGLGNEPALIPAAGSARSEEHTSELQSRENLV